MVLRRGQCGTEERTVHYCGEVSAFLRQGQCSTEERTVWY